MPRRGSGSCTIAPGHRDKFRLPGLCRLLVRDILKIGLNFSQGCVPNGVSVYDALVFLCFCAFRIDTAARRPGRDRLSRALQGVRSNAVPSFDARRRADATDHAISARAAGAPDPGCERVKPFFAVKNGATLLCSTALNITPPFGMSRQIACRRSFRPDYSMPRL